MKICVCIKQVPGSSKVDIDEKTGVLKRSGAEAKLNPYDLYTVETALRIKEMLEGLEVTLTALTMGPPQAKEALEEAYMMGADEMVLMSDRRFAGSDCLATSYALSQGIGYLGGFDLVITGKQTTDGDTAQVGPELAEMLGMPSVANVGRILAADRDSITVEYDMPESVNVARVALPCLLSVDRGRYSPRLPSYRRKKKLEGAPALTLTVDMLGDKDATHYGLDGSPTQVERIFPPEAANDRTVFDGTAEEAASLIYRSLTADKLV